MSFPYIYLKLHWLNCWELSLILLPYMTCWRDLLCPLYGLVSTVRQLWGTSKAIFFSRLNKLFSQVQDSSFLFTEFHDVSASPFLWLIYVSMNERSALRYMIYHSNLESFSDVMRCIVYSCRSQITIPNIRNLGPRKNPWEKPPVIPPKWNTHQPLYFEPSDPLNISSRQLSTWLNL